MEAILVEGGRPLVGGVQVHGAKNSVLPILAAAILAPGQSVIHNCPPLSDVAASLDILRHLGCRVEQHGTDLTVDADGQSLEETVAAVLAALGRGPARLR